MSIQQRWMRTILLTALICWTVTEIVTARNVIEAARAVNPPASLGEALRVGPCSSRLWRNNSMASHAPRVVKILS